MPISAIDQYCVELREDDPLRSYAEANLQLWADCGLLGDVIDSGARTRFANREELNMEKRLFERYGPMARVNRYKGEHYQVRIVLQLAYEFGTALYPLLPQRIMDQVIENYERAREACHHNTQDAEVLAADEDPHSRHFISGHARTKPMEFFAECIAAYSAESSREALLTIHPEMHALIRKLTEGSLR